MLNKLHQHFKKTSSKQFTVKKWDEGGVLLFDEKQKFVRARTLDLGVVGSKSTSGAPLCRSLPTYTYIRLINKQN